MQTKQEIINWIKLREQELINLEYELIDSLNYPEVDNTVRTLRKHTYNFGEALHTVRNIVESNLKQDTP